MALAKQNTRTSILLKLCYKRRRIPEIRKNFTSIDYGIAVCGKSGIHRLNPASTPKGTALSINEVEFSCCDLTQFVEVHAIRFRTRLILHEMRAVFCGAQRRLQSPPVDEDVVHHLNCTQSVV